MVDVEIRNRIHSLIEKASDTQLDAVLQILEAKFTDKKYSQKDIDSFYERISLFEDSGSKGYTVAESHNMIRDKRK